VGYRDPQTGTCDYLGGGGDGGCCGDGCVYNGGAAGTNQALPDWGQCNSACDGLDENSCIETTGCHAAYLATTQGETGPTTTSFLGCWATATGQATLPPTACAGLDAQTCSERDYCSMVYTSNMVSAQQFGSCVAETHSGCGVDIGCPMGSHCEQQCEPCNSMGCQDACNPTCVPDTGCDQIDCGAGYECVESCTGTTCGVACVPSGHDPGQCTGQLSCNHAPPTCPANTTAGIANGCWTGYCIPNAACGSQDPGDCYATVTCNSAPPSCPSGTLPGIANGCWSGYCIPTAGCELAACETLGTEAACDARGDCLPIYTGNDCTCTMTNGCTCATETYAKCESVMMPL
ncbi:MAG: hypothetical protein ABI467_21295, partial [Kofleriaceae bacterium]